MTTDPDGRRDPADAAPIHPGDPDVVADALAATRADLAALPTPEPPPEAVARWAAALAAEAAPPPVARLLPRRPLLAAAVLAALVATGVGGLLHRPAPPAVTRVELVTLAREAVGTMDVGDLADPGRRSACLRAVAPTAVGEALLGGRSVVVDGRAGVLLVLATGDGGLRIVTVDPACGPGGGALIAQLVVA